MSTTHSTAVLVHGAYSQSGRWTCVIQVPFDRDDPS